MSIKKSVVLGLLALGLMAGPAQAADPAECKQVHFSDVGWSCITATTAIATTVLEGLGYQSKVDVLSVPVTFNSTDSRGYPPLNNVTAIGSVPRKVPLPHADFH